MIVFLPLSFFIPKQGSLAQRLALTSDPQDHFL